MAWRTVTGQRDNLRVHPASGDVKRRGCQAQRLGWAPAEEKE
jgi:hypothetical protein